MKRVARALLVAALFGAVAVAGQDMSSTAEVTPTPTPDAAASSTGVVPTPTPTPAQSSTGVTPTPTPAQSSTGVTPTPTPAMSSSASSSPSSVSSTGSVQPGAASSSGGSEPFSTGAAPFTAGLCDLLTTANGFNNRDEKNEETALGAVIQAAILGTENTKNGVKVTGIVNEPTLKPYFDGSINYHQNGPVRSPYAKSPSPNFIADSNAFNSLKSKLIAFFGQSAVLGCSAPGFPTYTLVGDDGKTYRQYEVHYNMNISGTEFGLFNKQIVDAAAYYGADATAQNVISSKLALFGRTNIAGANANEICHMDSCPCASDATGTNCDGINAASSIQASFVSLAVVAAGALFAMAL